jgi:hypothetical protein
MEGKESGGTASRLYELMSEAVLDKTPFTKWLRKEDAWTKSTLKSMSAELRAVTIVTGHYVYYDEEVKKAITTLYSNLKKNGVLEEPEAYVASALRRAIMRYIDAFNLRRSTSKILDVLE